MGRRRATEIAGEFTYKLTRKDYRVRYQSPIFDVANLSDRVEFSSAATVVILKLRMLHVKEVISRSTESIRSICYSYRL